MTGQNATGAEGGVWLVQGDDASLVREAVSGLVKDLLGGAEPSLALEHMDSEELDLAQVADACRTPPFLSDRRVVVVHDIGRFSLEQVQPLLTYLGEPLASTRLVLVGGGGQVPAKLVSAVKQVGTVISTDVSGKQVHTWLSEKLAQAPVKLAPSAAALLESHLGEDVSRLGGLLAALQSAYGPGARLGPEELVPYLGSPGPVPPWELTDAIDAGHAEKAVQSLHRMLEAGGRHPLVVLATLQRHFTNALAVQSPALRSEAQAAEILGIAKGRSTFPARKALGVARRLGARGTGDAVVALAEAELQLKGKIDWPPELVLEVLVARLCRLARASSRASGGQRP
ncbi:MAG: DNA polymerase III subunit delta [Acidimicrobiales bacterium]